MRKIMKTPDISKATARRWNLHLDRAFSYITENTGERFEPIIVRDLTEENAQLIFDAINQFDALNKVAEVAQRMDLKSALAELEQIKR